MAEGGADVEADYVEGEGDGLRMRREMWKSLGICGRVWGYVE